jgi:hypothetical protein
MPAGHYVIHLPAVISHLFASGTVTIDAAHVHLCIAPEDGFDPSKLILGRTCARPGDCRDKKWIMRIWSLVVSGTSRGAALISRS